MYSVIKTLLFQLPPEQAHKITLRLLGFGLGIPVINTEIRRLWAFEDSRLQRKVAGLHFPNPVGLAAGFDKNGSHLEEMSALGFGFLELGTVTPRPQPGNPRPRLFRLPADEALINRMGFNNEGVDALAARLGRSKPSGVIIGGNIGKNKSTPNEKAIDDYAYCFEKLFPVVDYFVVNVSSPNTPGLRALQQREPLLQLLRHLQEQNTGKGNPKPIFLKIAPDLDTAALSDIVELTGFSGIAGVIATNTTVSRDGLQCPDERLEKIGDGGLSGRPLRKRSTEVIRILRNELPENTAIIGVGGISSPEDALEKLEAGADLIQIYTGLVYQGPDLVKKIKESIIAKS